MINWAAHGIDINKVRGGKTFCPRCHQNRKHKSDRSLSVDESKGIFNCHNPGCGFKGTAVVREQRKAYNKPTGRIQKVGDKILSFFNGRGISNDTITQFKVTESLEYMPQFDREVSAMCFNYYRGEDLVNIKFRGPEKSFKLVSGAELIFYNLNSVFGSEDVVIVEGEIDAMSVYEAGIIPVVSVPNGASAGSMKLDYLDNCWEDIEPLKKVIIATDNDEPGRALREELARRIGKDKCYTVDFGDCKDSNEYLVKYGKEALRAVYDAAKPWPLEGVVLMDDMFDTVYDYYENGYPPGAGTGIMAITESGGIESMDEYITFGAGMLTMITGIPGSGKDEFLNLVMAKLAINAGWKFGVVGLEEPAEFHVTKMVEKFTGKSFMKRADKESMVNRDEFMYGVGMVDAHVSHINVDQTGASFENVLDTAARLVRSKGINGLVLNPWNCFEHNKPEGMSETDFVGRELDKIIAFARKYGVHVFLIAHPTKVKKSDGKNYDIPTLYSINGSANFFNKTHNGLVVYRDFNTNEVQVYVQKIKWPWMGKLGCMRFFFNTNTRQYYI